MLKKTARTAIKNGFMWLIMLVPLVFSPQPQNRGRSIGVNRDYACAVKRRWSTAGESPARELGSLHPEASGAAVEETKPSEPPV